MSSCKMTLIGFYQQDNKLFDAIKLPTGMNKETLIDVILMNGGEFEVLYSDRLFLKLAIKSWNNKWSATISKWYEALTTDYNPLENYDRMEESTDSGNGITDNRVSAFNSSALQNSDQNSTNYSNNHQARLHGNIGVTTSQQMLIQELMVRYNNIYDMVAGLFLNEFVIPVY